MTELNCENVCLAAMAMMDGDEAPLSTEAIENHLASCPDCREEVAQLRGLTELLSAQKRRDYTEDVWPAIRPLINEGLDAGVARQSGKTSAAAALAFAVLGVLLLCYKLAEMVPQADPGPLFKLVPVLLVLGVFGFLKENPFKINTSLRLEGE